MQHPKNDSHWRRGLPKRGCEKQVAEAELRSHRIRYQQPAGEHDKGSEYPCLPLDLPLQCTYHHQQLLHRICQSRYVRKRVTVFSYPALFRAMELGYGQTFPRQPMCCAQVEAEDIPLAFPLRESLCCDGSRLSAELGMAYTPLEKGMAHTVDALRPVICRP